MIGVKLNTSIQNRRDADVKMITRRGVRRLRPNTMVFVGADQRLISLMEKKDA